MVGTWMKRDDVVGASANSVSNDVDVDVVLFVFPRARN